MRDGGTGQLAAGTECSLDRLTRWRPAPNALFMYLRQNSQIHSRPSGTTAYSSGNGAVYQVSMSNWPKRMHLIFSKGEGPALFVDPDGPGVEGCGRAWSWTCDASSWSRKGRVELLGSFGGRGRLADPDGEPMACGVDGIDAYGSSDDGRGPPSFACEEESGKQEEASVLSSSRGTPVRRVGRRADLCGLDALLEPRLVVVADL